MFDMNDENINIENYKSNVGDSPIPFLDSVMRKSTDHVRHFDIQTNILIGISLAILAFSVSQLNGSNIQIPVYILIISTIISIFIGVYAIHPPKYMRKRGQEESIFYNKKVVGFGSSESFATEIKNVLQNKDEMIKNYSIEIFNLYKYYYQPKRKLFKISRNFLLLGIFLSIVTYLLQIFA